jgi:phosphoribosylformylglycinamidine synthase
MTDLITTDLITQHGFTEDEYAKVLEILGREPNLVELGIFSVMWSEHCSYKSSRIHLKNLPVEAPHVIQGPGENAGIVDIGNGLAVVFKMESHNHPSYIEPYQGAATGVGGILRDIFTMGARPVALLNSLRFGSMDHPRTRSLLKGIVAGIADYGNCVGVPTVGGEVYFHESYNGNCLVNAMAVGIVKKDKIFKGKASGVENPVIYVGSKTGRDGIHGATMASNIFGEGGEEKRPTVQVGDPFTEKLLLEACLEVFKTDYVVGIQDMGAAGLTSSSVEMASRGGNGIELDISLVPRREEGMIPYEIMLSESQERMLLVVKKGSETEVAGIFQKWGLDAKVVGTVTGDGCLRLKEEDRVVAEIPVNALTEDVPKFDRPIQRPSYQDEVQELNIKDIKEPRDYNEVLLKLLSSPNICSREWVYRQYDHMVRTDTVVLPGSDAAVLRIKGTNSAIAITTDCNSRYCYLDPFTGGAIAVAEAARNLVSVGARPLALTDCLNFGNPERPEIMWQFRECVSGMREACLKLDIPVISGNVSFYNETSGESVYPTPTIGMVGLIDNINLHITHSFKNEGDIILLIGKTEEELGGSEYLKVIHGLERGMPPLLDLEMDNIIQNACLDAVRAGIIKSAHDCSEGGLAVTLAECCMSSSESLGVDITVPPYDIRHDAALFGESQSRMVMCVAEKDIDEFMSIADRYGIPSIILGRVAGKRLRINRLIDIAVDECSKVWKGTIEGYLQ